VLFDCTFIQQGALRDLWDQVIYLDAEDTVARARGIARDANALGRSAAAAAAYDTRYLAACRIYRDEEHPESRASILIDNTDPHRPRRLRH
jgi:uridine kinase